MPLNSSQLQTTTWASVPARISRCLRAAPGEQKVSGTSISLPMRAEQLQDPGGTPPRGVQTQAIRSTRTQTLGRGGTGRAQGSKGTWVESQGCGFHTMILTPAPNNRLLRHPSVTLSLIGAVGLHQNPSVPYHLIIS